MKHFSALNENNFNPTILYSAKLSSFKIVGAIKVFHDKQKLKEYMTTKTMRGQSTTNHKRRKDKESESNINSAAHNQTLKQQKQLNDRNQHILTNINTEC
jgi:hypothetical protein